MLVFGRSLRYFDRARWPTCSPRCLRGPRRGAPALHGILSARRGCACARPAAARRGPRQPASRSSGRSRRAAIRGGARSRGPQGRARSEAPARQRSGRHGRGAERRREAPRLHQLVAPRRGHADVRYHEPLLLAAAAAGWLHAGRFDASVTLAVPPPARARSDKASSTDVSLDGAGDITLTELASERLG